MNVELSVLSDGNVMMVCDRPLPDIVRRVEYYREQRQMMLVYYKSDMPEQLMEYEIPAEVSPAVERTPNILIFSLFPDHEPIGYKAPLVQVGDRF